MATIDLKDFGMAAKIKFYECNKAIDPFRVIPYLWPGYTRIRGHINGEKGCRSIIVTNEDACRFADFRFAWRPDPGSSGWSYTFEMDITPVKHLFGDYYKLGPEFKAHKGRFCAAS